MQKNKLLQKFIAMLLIFTLTFANFAVVSKSYAASFAETLFGSNSDTGHKNIEFETYFVSGISQEEETEEQSEKIKEISSDVNNNDLAIKLKLNVLESGYLKNAKVELLEGEEGKNLNFEIGKNQIKENSQTLQTHEINNDETENIDYNDLEENNKNENEEEIDNNTVSLDEEISQNEDEFEEKEADDEESEVEAQNSNNEFEEILNNNQDNNNQEEIENSEQEAENDNLNIGEQKEETEKIEEQDEEIENIEKQNEEMENIEEQNEEVENSIEPNDKTEKIEEQDEKIENSEEPIIDNQNDEVTENIEEELVFPEYVDSLEDNVLYLNQISSTSEINIDLPIRYKNEEYVSRDIVSNNCKIRFSGIYVDGEGKEHDVQKEELLKLDWTDEREFVVETGTTKYIDFGDGVILQTIVRTNNEEGGNRLPIEKSEIELEVPILANTKPSNVLVVANSLEGTNGEETGNLSFDENNWIYNENENKVQIEVYNEEKLVKSSDYKDEIMLDEEEIEEEKLFNGNGIDEYLVTFTYSGISIEDVETSMITNIKASLTSIGGTQNTSDNNYQYDLNNSQGNIVSLNIGNETKEISKAYSYINYNNAGKYEIELINNEVINVSYKDIIKDLKLEDVSNTYIDKEGNELDTEDTYYKRIEISKENFDKMLGEAGEIRVFDGNGNEIGKLNSSIEANEEGNIVLAIESKVSKLNYEITKPISEGNIVIRNVKAISNLSIDKQALINMSKISSKTKLKADYEYVEETVEVEEKVAETVLNDTLTRANIKLDRESLSTLSLNENVEIRVELNNARLESDIYGHSVFEIELPEYIESLEITNTKMLYGEGLEISEIVPDGRIIRITVDGVQDGINTGVLTNGANIVINANIKVNLYTPAKKEMVKLRYVNDEATGYENDGYSETEVSYSAPTGLVAVNSIEGYHDADKIQSVRQGKVTDLIDIFAERKEATEEIIVMNNNGNEITNVRILGRFPFKGAKDILTGDNLGTTLDARIISGIVSDERNRGAFKVYYSENEEATSDLNEARNAWTEEIENLDNIKSYLIIPEDNYVMADTEVLRFTYRFEIPENLNHNENIFGTFMAEYKNNSDIMVTDEREVADIVGLTTGEGPELNVEITSNKEKMKEYEELEVTIKGKNVGENKVQNLVASFPIPEQMSYLSDESNFDKLGLSFENNQVIAKIDELKASEEFEYKVNLVANELEIIEDEVEETKLATSKVQPKINLDAKDLGATLEAVGNATEIESAKIRLNEEIINTTSNKFTSKDKFSINIEAENLTEETLNNVVVIQELPSELNFEEAYITRYDASKKMEVKIGEGSYNENNRTITYNIDSLLAEETVNLKYIVEVNELSENNVNSKVALKSLAKIDNSEIVESSDLIVNFAVPSVSVNQTLNITDTYIKDGSTIDYIFTIKNNGNYEVKDFKFSDVMPEGMVVDKVVLKSGEEETEIPSSNSEAIVTGTLEAGQEIIVTVTARASYLVGSKEKSISNSATITGSNIQTIKSNATNNIIESSLDMSRVGAVDSLESSNSNPELSSSVNNNIIKTYRIDGLAWEDTNKDGMRNDGEKLLNGIIVKLVNNETGVIVKTMSTTFDGTYSFTNVPNGNYLVIFEYDTVKYAVTTYHKDNVGANINSDVIATTIEQDGKAKNAAITDIININNGSVSGIDIGLMLADSFDLELEKTVSKITVQTSKGSTTNDFNDSKLGKIEIASKYVSGAKVLVEYNIKVTNIGDISGYAKKIVDYIPEGMKFNSSISTNAENWYTGSDGNLYSTALANTELKKGESRTIKLVLTREMTEDNTGIVNNLAEIYEDYNIYGVSDRNSTPANKAQGENDLGSADSVILIKTGETLIYISVIITTILIATTVILIVVQKKKSLKNMEGGV